MSFVIHAQLFGVTSTWVSDRLPDGFRTLVTRDDAAVFATHSDARAAIEDLSELFRSPDITFSIEPKSRLD
jgi:hypothetical protein